MCRMLGKRPHTINWQPMPISPLWTSLLEVRVLNLPSIGMRPSSVLLQMAEAKRLSQLSSLDLRSSGRIAATTEHVPGGGVEAGRSGLPLPPTTDNGINEKRPSGRFSFISRFPRP